VGDQVADLADKAAVEKLLTPMFQEIHGRRKPMEQAKKQLMCEFTKPELEAISQALAADVDALDKIEAARSLGVLIAAWKKTMPATS
jgi:hypothetical protein